MLDDFDELTFPEARYLMGAVERDYWADPKTLSTIGEARAIFAAGAQRRLEALGDRLESFEDGARSWRASPRAPVSGTRRAIWRSAWPRATRRR